MSNFSSAASAQRKARVRALGRPSACWRSMWMSGTLGLLVLEQAVAFGLGQFCQGLGFIIEPGPVARDRAEQAFEAGHELVVRRLRAERGVVRLRHPLVGHPQAGRLEMPAVAQLLVVGTE